jgi:hypothetical protein
MASEMERREHFGELSLLRSRGVKLRLSIIGKLQVMSPLLARMRAATLHHAGVVRELTMLRATVSSTTELVLGCLPGATS